MEDSAEVRFAQTLASNEKKFRDRALKRLYKYLNVRSTHGEGLSHEDFIKIWKGLHYCMWMQDKPVIQEELSEKIGNLLKAFPNLEDALRFVNVFFITQAREWSGIDRLRLDKFMMLIREILHEALVRMSGDGWPCSACQSLSHYLTVSVMNEENAKLPYGLKTHLSDIFLTEMRKVSWAGINGKKLSILMFPFIYFLVKTKRRDLVKTVFDKTVKPVLESHGVWSWQGKARKRKPKKGAFVMAPQQALGDEDEEEEESNEEEDESDDEVEMQEEESGDEEEEENEDDDTGSEGDEDMDVDEENEDVPKPKGAKRRFDLSKMLRLMQCLSERPNVESRNRGMMYGVVRSYTTRDPSILSNQEDTSIIGDGSAAKTGSDNDDNGDVDESIIAQLLGEIEGKKSNKKRRRRRGQEEKYYPDEGGEDGDNSTESTTTNATSTKDKQSKKKRKLDSEEVGVEEKGGNQAKRKKQKQDLCGGDGMGKKLNTGVELQKKMKKQKGAVSNGVVSSQESSASSENKKKQKKKAAKQAHQSSDGSESCVDANTNARPTSPSKPKKGLKSVSASAIEMVVYPQKLPKAPTSLTPKVPSSNMVHIASSPPAMSRMMAWESASELPVTLSTNVESPLIQSLDSRHNRRATVNSKTRSPTQVLVNSGPGEVNDRPTAPNSGGGGLMDSLMKVVTTPTNFVKKCVAMATTTVAPATDPGVQRQMSAVTSDQFMTPGTLPKKVVFDLRRNTANKFKDYLKTLATDTSPAFEPSKSPSQGILKSPSNTSLDQLSNSDTPRPRRKATKTGSPKSKKSPLSVGKRKGIKSPLVKRLR